MTVPDKMDAARAGLRACILWRVAVLVGASAVALAVAATLPAVRELLTDRIVAPVLLGMAIVCMFAPVFLPHRWGLVVLSVSSTIVSLLLAAKVGTGVVVTSLVASTVLLSLAAATALRFDVSGGTTLAIIGVGVSVALAASVVNVLVLHEPLVSTAVAAVLVVVATAGIVNAVSHYANSTECIENCCAEGAAVLWLDFLQLFQNTAIVASR